MSEEWGTPISKEKIIDRRNRLIEYQKTQDMRFTVGYQIIDENILDINYMIYEIERLNNILNETRRILGEYKHFSTPTEEQNSENEEIVDKAYIKLHSNLQELKGNNNGVWVNNLLEVIKENNIEFGSNKE